MAIEVNCDARNILANGRGASQIGISGLIREKANGRNTDKDYLDGVEISRPSGGSLRIATSSYAGKLRDAFRCFDTSQYLKRALTELLLGGGNIDIVAMIRDDNFSVAEHVRSINSVTMGE